MPCEHERFKSRVSVQNPRDCPDDPEAGYSATITITCGICGVPFEFVGVSPEPRKDRPMVAVEGRELRVPLVPKGSAKKEGPVQ